MRKIAATVLALIVLLMLLQIPRTREDGAVPDKENNIASLSDKEGNTENQSIILPGFVELDLNNPGKALCNLNEDFYLQFNIILKDSEELIYSSGLVEYGNYINEIKLNKELQKGVHDAFILIQPYDLGLNKTNNAKFNIKLIV